MAQKSKRRDVVGLTLCIAALLACGPKTWSTRTSELPTRTLSVDEQQLFAPKSAGGCTSTVVVRVKASCEKRCASLSVSRDGELFATLLGSQAAEVAPIPEAARPSYMQPGRDGSRNEVAIPLPSAGASLGLVNACGALFRTKDARLVAEGNALSARADTARACGSLQAEVDCP